MKKHYALEAVLTAQWCITPEYLQLIADIATREHEYAGNLEALEARLGRPLGNAQVASVRDGVAIIPISGPLFKRASFFQAISGATDYTTLAQDLTTALEDPAVKAVMLMIDSPGGEVGGLSDLVAMVRAAGKPVHAHIDGIGASAAYWLASAADRVTASATAVIGSVGAQMGMTLKDPKPGEKAYRFVSSASPYKNAGPDTEDGAARIQALVDDLGQLFLASAAENRGVSVEFAAKNFGQGAVMVAAKAAESSMIDGVTTFEAAFADLKQELNSMDYSTLTAQALADNRPDLVAALRAEGAASVEKVDAAAVRAQAIEDERKRITAIEALAMPGAESVIAACKADGTTAEQAAVKIVHHMRTTQASRGTQAMENIRAAETSMTPPNAGAGDEDLSAEQRLEADMAAIRKAGMIR